MGFFSDITFRRVTPARPAIAFVMVSIVFAAGCGGKGGPIQPPPPPGQLQLACPAGRLLEASSPAGANLQFDSPVVTGGLAPIAVECAPGSGSVFPVGETNVQCTATAADTARASCGFVVRVRVSQVLEHTKFVAFGDSITEGAISLAPLMLLAPPDTYPFKLEQMLTQRFPAQAFVVSNQGRGGERTTQGVTRLPSVLHAEQPEVLLLLEGINTVNELSTAQQANALESMIDDARRAGVQTIIATVMPMMPAARVYRATTNAKIVALNQRIFELADKYRIGEPVDLFAIFEAEPYLIGRDGLHPTLEGQTRIAEAFRDEIVRRYEVRSTLSSRRMR